MPRFDISLDNGYDVTDIEAPNEKVAFEAAVKMVHGYETIDNQKADASTLGTPDKNPKYAETLLNMVRRADKYEQLTGDKFAWNLAGFTGRDAWNEKNITTVDNQLRSAGQRTITDITGEEQAKALAQLKKKNLAIAQKKYPNSSLVDDGKGGYIPVARDKQKMNAPSARSIQNQKIVKSWAGIDRGKLAFSDQAMDGIADYVKNRFISVNQMPNARVAQIVNELTDIHPQWNIDQLADAVKFATVNQGSWKTKGTREGAYAAKLNSKEARVTTSAKEVKTAAISGAAGAAVGVARHAFMGDKLKWWLKQHGITPDETSAMIAEVGTTPLAILSGDGVAAGAGKLVKAVSGIADARQALNLATKTFTGIADVAKGVEEAVIASKYAKQAGLISRGAARVAKGAMGAPGAIASAVSKTKAGITAAVDVANVWDKSNNIGIRQIYDMGKLVTQNPVASAIKFRVGVDVAREALRGYETRNGRDLGNWFVNGLKDTMDDLVGPYAQGFENNERLEAIRVAVNSDDPELRRIAGQEAAAHGRAADQIMLDPQWQKALQSGAWEDYKVNPVKYIAMMFGSSFATQYKSFQKQAMATALFTGAGEFVARTAGATFAGLGSAATEYASVWDDELRKNGIDTSNAEQLDAFLKNPEMMRRINKGADARAGVVGLGDGLSAFVGGLIHGKVQGGVSSSILSNMAKTSITAKDRFKLAAGLFADMAVQSTAGGGFEALGQMARAGDTGAKLSKGDIVAEAFGEFSSLSNIALGVMAHNDKASTMWNKVMGGMSTEAKFEMWKQTIHAASANPDNIELVAKAKGLRSALEAEAQNHKDGVVNVEVKDEKGVVINSTPIDISTEALDAVEQTSKDAFDVTKMPTEKKQTMLVDIDTQYASTGEAPNPAALALRSRLVSSLTQQEMRDMGLTEFDDNNVSEYDKRIAGIVDRMNANKDPKIAEDKLAQTIVATYKDQSPVTSTGVDVLSPDTSASTLLQEADKVQVLIDEAQTNPDMLDQYETDMDKINLGLIQRGYSPSYRGRLHKVTDADTAILVAQGVQDNTSQGILEVDGKELEGTITVSSNGAFFHPSDPTLDPIHIDYTMLDDLLFVPKPEVTEPYVPVAEQFVPETQAPVEQPQEAAAPSPAPAPVEERPVSAPTKPVETPAVSEVVAEPVVGPKSQVEQLVIPEEVKPVDHSKETVDERPRHRQMNPNDIEVNADVFQFKGNKTATGTTGSLSGVSMWDENMAGSISVWTDPKDGKTYVVNGHNRLAKARELGVEKVWVFELQAKDAAEATLIGALQNISEGHGTAIDAAKIFRAARLENKLEEMLAKMGKSLTNQVAKDGIGLSWLAPSLLRQVENGALPQTKLALIGSIVHDENKQMQIVNALGGEKGLEKYTVDTIVPIVNGLMETTSMKKSTSDPNLGFGDAFEDSDWGAAFDDSMQNKANIFGKIYAEMKRQLSTLNYTSKESRADVVAEAGGYIDIAQSKTTAVELQKQLDMFEIYGLRSEFSDIMNRIMEDYQNAKPSEKANILERGQRDIQQRASELYESQFGSKGNSNVSGAPEMGAGLFDEIPQVVSNPQQTPVEDIVLEHSGAITPEDTAKLKEYGHDVENISVQQIKPFDTTGSASEEDIVRASGVVASYPAWLQSLSKRDAQYQLDLEALRTLGVNKTAKGQMIADRINSYLTDKAHIAQREREYTTAMHATVLHAVETALLNPENDTRSAGQVFSSTGELIGTDVEQVKNRLAELLDTVGSVVTMENGVLGMNIYVDGNKVHKDMFIKGSKSTTYEQTNLARDISSGIQDTLAFINRFNVESMMNDKESVPAKYKSLVELIIAYSEAATLFTYANPNGKKSPMLGAYHMVNRTIELANMNDISTWLHEFGHHLIKGDELDGVVKHIMDSSLSGAGYQAFNPEMPKVVDSMLRELLYRTGQNVTGDDIIDNANGIAEAFRLYTLDPDQFMHYQPTLFRLFDEALPATTKEMSKDIRRQLIAMSIQGNVDYSVEITANIEESKGLLQRILKPGSNYLGAGYETSGWDALSWALVDRYVPAIKMLENQMKLKGLSKSEIEEQLKIMNALITRILGAPDAAKAAYIGDNQDIVGLEIPDSNGKKVSLNTVLRLLDFSVDGEQRVFNNYILMKSHIEDALLEIGKINTLINSTVKALAARSGVVLDDFDAFTPQGAVDALKFVSQLREGKNITDDVVDTFLSLSDQDVWNSEQPGLARLKTKLKTVLEELRVFTAQGTAFGQELKPEDNSFMVALKYTRELEESGTDQSKRVIEAGNKYNQIAQAVTYMRYVDGIYSAKEYEVLSRRQHYADWHRVEDEAHTADKSQKNTLKIGRVLSQDTKAGKGTEMRAGSKSMFLDPIQSLAKQITAAYVDGAKNSIKSYVGEYFLNDSPYADSADAKVATGSIGHEITYVQPPSQETMTKNRVFSYYKDGKTKYIQLTDDFAYRSLLQVDGNPNMEILQHYVGFLRAMIVNTPGFTILNSIRDRWGVMRKTQHIKQPVDYVKLWLQYRNNTEVKQSKTNFMGGSVMSPGNKTEFLNTQDQIQRDILEGKLGAVGRLVLVLKEATGLENTGNKNIFKKYKLKSVPVATAMWRWGQGLSEKSELAPKMLEYELAFKVYQAQENGLIQKEIDRLKLDRDDEQDAAQIRIITARAKQMTVLRASSDARALQDFARVGNALPGLNALFGPFLSGRASGLRADMQTLTRSNASRTRAFTMMLFMALRGVAEDYLWNTDPDRRVKWRSIPSYLKDTYSLVPVDFISPGMILSLPLGFEDAQFASVGRYMADAVWSAKDKNAVAPGSTDVWKEMGPLLLQWADNATKTIFPITPDNVAGIFGTPTQALANKNFFQNFRDIVNPNELPRKLFIKRGEATDYPNVPSMYSASRLGMFLSQLVPQKDVNPRMIDFIIQDTLGTTGRNMLNFSNIGYSSDPRKLAYVDQQNSLRRSYGLPEQTAEEMGVIPSEPKETVVTASLKSLGIFKKPSVFFSEELTLVLDKIAKYKPLTQSERPWVYDPLINASMAKDSKMQAIYMKQAISEANAILEDRKNEQPEVVDITQ